MSAFARRWSDSVGGRPKLYAVIAAVVVSLVGLLAGLIGILLLRGVLLTPSITESGAFRVVSGNLIQVGFAGFGLAYVALRGWNDRFCLLRRPTSVDAGWIVAATIAVVLGGAVVASLLSSVGLPEPMPAGGNGTVDLGSDPAIWLVGFVGLFLIAAPAEELVYRGIVQGHLRPAFEVPGVIVGGALAFALMHFLVGLLTADVGFAGSLHWGIAGVVPGLVWGYAYERTENLVVTATSHALTWTVPFQALLPVL